MNNLQTYVGVKSMAYSAMQMVEGRAPQALHVSGNQVTFDEPVTLNLHHRTGHDSVTIQPGTTFSLHPTFADAHERILLDHASSSCPGPSRHLVVSRETDHASYRCLGNNVVTVQADGQTRTENLGYWKGRGSEVSSCHLHPQIRSWVSYNSQGLPTNIIDVFAGGPWMSSRGGYPS